MLKKILSSTIIKLVLAVIAGILLGFVVGEGFMNVVVTLKYIGTAYFLYGTLDYSGFYIFFYRKNERECFTDAGMGIRIGLSFVCRSCFYGHVFRLLADPVTDY